MSNKIAASIGTFIGNLGAKLAIIAMQALILMFVYNRGVAWEFNLPQMDYLTCLGVWYLMKVLFCQRTK